MPMSQGAWVRCRRISASSEEELRINAGQQKAWDAYATRVIRLADDVARARFATRELEGTAITAPQLFDRITETRKTV